MAPSAFQVRLADVERLSGEMRDAARAQDWDRLTELEDRRRGALAHLFAGAPPTCERARLVEAIRRVLEIDREVIARGETGRQEAATALGDLDRGRRGIAAYRSTAGG